MVVALLPLVSLLYGVCTSEMITDSSFERGYMERARLKLGGVRDLHGKMRAALRCLAVKSRP